MAFEKIEGMSDKEVEEIYNHLLEGALIPGINMPEGRFFMQHRGIMMGGPRGPRRMMRNPMPMQSPMPVERPQAEQRQPQRQPMQGPLQGIMFDRIGE